MHDEERQVQAFVANYDLGVETRRWGHVMAALGDARYYELTERERKGA